MSDHKSNSLFPRKLLLKYYGLRLKDVHYAQTLYILID